MVYKKGIVVTGSVRPVALEHRDVDRLEHRAVIELPRITVLRVEKLRVYTDRLAISDRTYALLDEIAVATCRTS